LSTDYLVRPSPRPTAAVRLFCLPHAGAGASAYRGWAQDLGPDLDVCYVQLPGRENRFREPPFTSLESLVDAVATALAPLVDRPYLLYGHSFGGIVAFEVARELRRRGLGEPRHFFASASRAPHLPWPHPPIRQLAGADLLREVNRRYDSVPAAILEDVELRDLLVPALRADLGVLETYRHAPGRPLACGITVFGGRQDRMITLAELDGWSEHTAGAFRLQLLEGGHMLLQTARGQLFEVIASTLEAAAEGAAWADGGRMIYA
jgi:medium-chain acyl-[acyl-carrier-protein] hydrolase